MKAIIENMQLNQGVMSYANANKIQAVMIAFDQEKAFDDRVDWSFLFKALYFWYGPEIIQKIKTGKTYLWTFFVY